MKYTCFYVIPFLMITACTGVEGERYIGAPGSAMWHATASPSTVAAHYGRHCIAYGFRPGSEAFARCLQDETLASRKRADSRINADANRQATDNTRMHKPVAPVATSPLKSRTSCRSYKGSLASHTYCDTSN